MKMLKICKLGLEVLLVNCSVSIFRVTLVLFLIIIPKDCILRILLVQPQNV